MCICLCLFVSAHACVLAFQMVFQFLGDGGGARGQVALDDITFSPECTHDPDNSQLPSTPVTPTATATASSTQQACGVRVQRETNAQSSPHSNAHNNAHSNAEEYFGSTYGRFCFGAQ